MKIDENKIDVEMSDVFKDKTSEFRMESSAIAFEILTTKIYTRPVDAIVRELACNARDAHIEAGTQDRPIEIFLPSSQTYDNPFKAYREAVSSDHFTIRDYGTGLSPEQIENLYTVFFSSNKRDTNDLTGCFGIGSKSPFAYSDTFSVASYYNGKKHLYVMSKSATGVPSVTSIASTDTTEDNGLEISIPVKSQDITKFQSAAQWLFAFETKPRIACPEFNHKDFDVRYKYFHLKTPGDFSIRILPLSDEFQESTRHIEMGGVIYGMPRILNTHNIWTQDFYRGSMIILRMPTGSLSPSPSREEIHLDVDGKAEKAIRKELDRNKESLRQWLNKHQETKPTDINEITSWLLGYFDKIHKVSRFASMRFANITNLISKKLTSGLRDDLLDTTLHLKNYTPHCFKIKEKDTEKEVCDHKAIIVDTDCKLLTLTLGKTKFLNTGSRYRNPAPHVELYITKFTVDWQDEEFFAPYANSFMQYRKPTLIVIDSLRKYTLAYDYINNNNSIRKFTWIAGFKEGATYTNSRSIPVLENPDAFINKFNDLYQEHYYYDIIKLSDIVNAEEEYRKEEKKNNTGFTTSTPATRPKTRPLYERIVDQNGALLPIPYRYSDSPIPYQKFSYEYFEKLLKTKTVRYITLSSRAANGCYGHIEPEAFQHFNAQLISHIVAKYMQLNGHGRAPIILLKETWQDKVPNTWECVDTYVSKALENLQEVINYHGLHKPTVCKNVNQYLGDLYKVHIDDQETTFRSNEFRALYKAINHQYDSLPTGLFREYESMHWEEKTNSHSMILSSLDSLNRAYYRAYGKELNVSSSKSALKVHSLVIDEVFRRLRYVPTSIYALITDSAPYVGVNLNLKEGYSYV